MLKISIRVHKGLLSDLEVWQSGFRFYAKLGGMENQYKQQNLAVISRKKPSLTERLYEIVLLNYI